MKPGTKIDGAIYRDELLELLSAIRNIADEIYIFQQDRAPARRARQTVELLRRETALLLTCGRLTVRTSIQ